MLVLSWYATFENLTHTPSQTTAPNTTVTANCYIICVVLIKHLCFSLAVAGHLSEELIEASSLFGKDIDGTVTIKELGAVASGYAAAAPPSSAAEARANAAPPPSPALLDAAKVRVHTLGLPLWSTEIEREIGLLECLFSAG